MPFAVLFIVVLGNSIWFVSYILGRDSPEDFGGHQETEAIAGVAGPSGRTLLDIPSPSETSTIFNTLDYFKPSVPDLPQSAPIFDSVTRIVAAPRIEGCLLLELTEYTICKCNDQRGNCVDISLETCRNFIRRGFFDPTVGG